jgi:hypothetical protein
MPFARTFVIGLAIVGLLIPGGLLMTLCRCDGGGWQVISARGMPPCCSAPRQLSGSQSLSVQRPPCGACHIVVIKTPERDTLAPALSVPELAPLALGTPVTISFALIPTDRERLAFGRHDLAPPGRLLSLPLRI